MRVAAVLVFGLSLLGQAAFAGTFIPAERPIEGSYIVVFQDTALKHGSAPTAPGLTVPQLAGELGLLYGGRFTRTFEHALKGGVIEMSEAQARIVARDPRVAWVEEDQAIEAFTTVLALATWWCDRTDERDRPLNNHYTYNKTGSGVNLYIIDTGVSNPGGHFNGRLYNAYSTVLDASGNPVFGDPVGHGTNVAVHAASSSWGVARGAKVQAVRVKTVSCGGTGGGGGDVPAYASTCFSLSALLDAINWVAGHRVTPAVANLSLGGGVSSTLDNAVIGMVNAGVTVVAAAGNSNASACNVSPAHLSQVITVGATTSGDARASFSNYGSCVDLFAPGDQVYFGLSGTSFAAPIVVGVAAQYLQGSPSASPATVKSYLINNATSGRLSSIGSGSPNRLVYAPPGGTEVDNPPVANFTYSCNGRTCSFTSTTTDDFSVGYCSWTWGHAYDYQPNTGCSLSHTFPSAGGFTVILTAYDDAWQPNQKVKTVTVN